MEMKFFRLDLRLLFTTFFLVLSLNLFAQAHVHWSDLPQDHLKDILYEYEDRIDMLDRHIQQYHKLKKINWKFIPKRISLLKEISFLAQKTAQSFSTSSSVEESYLHNALSKLSIIASRKQNYLEELFKLKNYKLKQLKQDIYIADHISGDYVPFTLNDGRKIKYQTQEIWGQYFIEAVDPCHRRSLNSYHDIWFKEFPEDELFDFFLWLEDKNVSLFFPAIIVPTEDELVQYQIEVRAGRFYSNNGELITTEPTEKEKINPEVPNFMKEPIFIINPDEKLYLGYSGREFAHTSLSYYRPIIGSGTIWLQGGLVTKLSLSSGHYLTNMEQNIQTFKILEQKGVNFNSCKEVLFFDGYHEQSLSVEAFKKRYF